MILGDGAEEEEEEGTEEEEEPFMSASRMFFKCVIRSPRFFLSLISRCTSTSVAALAYTNKVQKLNC